MTVIMNDRLSIEVDLGPDWIFVKPVGADLRNAEFSGFAEAVWRLLEQADLHRVVLELELLPILRSLLIGELVMLHKRVHAHGGLLRICGLSDNNHEVLRISRLDSRFPQYANRGAAVMGHMPKPR